MARLVCEAGDQHRNRSGIIHGGLMLSMIVCSSAASALTACRSVRASASSF